MVNATDINISEISSKGNFIFEKIKSLSEIVRGWVENFGVSFSGTFSTILTICIGLVLIIIGAKITNKIAKFLLIIFGAILLFGIMLNIFTMASP